VIEDVPLSLAPTLLYSHNTGVSPTQTRRRFTAAFKLQTLEAAAQCTKPGELGVLLRREGLYSSHLVAWRAAVKIGTLVVGAPRRRGPKPPPPDPSSKQIALLERQLERATARAERLELIVELQKRSGAAPRPRTAGDRRRARDTVVAAVAEHGARCGIAALSTALGLPPATYYRVQKTRMIAAAGDAVPAAPRAAPARALRPDERTAVLTALHERRFLDLAPTEVYATLLDEGIYHCSERTMYRGLAAQGEARDRRAQRRHPHYAAPELLATAPNQLWSWDITKLKGPTTWAWYHLYVLLDVFSRYAVGWMIAPRESAALAERLIATSCERQGILRGQLTLHADRGSSMTSKPIALLLAELGVTKTHSRPHVSNDNPYSEAMNSE
jgi:putative transposase